MQNNNHYVSHINESWISLTSIKKYYNKYRLHEELEAIFGWVGEVCDTSKGQQYIKESITLKIIKDKVKKKST